MTGDIHTEQMVVIIPPKKPVVPEYEDALIFSQVDDFSEHLFNILAAASAHDSVVSFYPINERNMCSLVGVPFSNGT